jgi:hypothetical protein
MNMSARHLLRRSRVAAAAAVAATAVCLAASALAPAAASDAGAVINATFQDVSCTSASSCMAVGSAEHATGQPPYITLAEQWNGSTWTVLPTPTPYNVGGGGELLGVSCLASARCMAVGQSLVFDTHGGYLISHPLAEAWNGTAWTTVPTPKLADTGAVLNGISCTAASNCMAVGSEGSLKNDTEFTFAEVWNGTAWKFVPTPAPLTPGGTALNRISCTGQASCMAVGYYGYNNGTGTSVNLTETWNGNAWRRVTAPAPDSNASLGGVSCATSSSCDTVGTRLTNFGTATLAAQWDGKRWKMLATPNPKQAGGAGLNDVACPGRAACMAVGGWTDPTGEYGFTLAESWNGTSWTLLGTPNPGGAVNDLYGVSCTAASSCMAVGSQLGQVGSGQTLAEAWNGTRWRVVRTPSP